MDEELGDLLSGFDPERLLLRQGYPGQILTETTEQLGEMFRVEPCPCGHTKHPFELGLFIFFSIPGIFSFECCLYPTTVPPGNVSVVIAIGC